jgi:hypothetical protein
VEVIAPGFLILKQTPGDETGKFVNIAVVRGDEIKIVDQVAARAPDGPELLRSLLGFERQHSATASVNVLIQLAVSMRAHGRGGTLLVVPANTNAWRDSTVKPILYSLSPASSLLADLAGPGAELKAAGSGMNALRRAVDSVAGLTAVDGATIITDQYELLAFGAKIVRRPRSPLVARIIMTEPIENSNAEQVEPAQLGGTRHLSAAQFAHDQRDSIALVASQDGRFTALAWSSSEQIVHAHRLETLLL